MFLIFIRSFLIIIHLFYQLSICGCPPFHKLFTFLSTEFLVVVHRRKKVKIPLFSSDLTTFFTKLCTYPQTLLLILLYNLFYIYLSSIADVDLFPQGKQSKEGITFKKENVFFSLLPYKRAHRVRRTPLRANAVSKQQIGALYHIIVALKITAVEVMLGKHHRFIKAANGVRVGVLPFFREFFFLPIKWNACNQPDLRIPFLQRD